MLVFKAIPLSGFQCPNSLAAQESNGILTNLTNKIFSGFFAGEVVGVFRDKVHRTTEKFFCPAKGPLGRDIFF